MLLTSKRRVSGFSSLYTTGDLVSCHCHLFIAHWEYCVFRHMYLDIIALNILSNWSSIDNIFMKFKELSSKGTWSCGSTNQCEEVSIKCHPSPVLWQSFPITSLSASSSIQVKDGGVLWVQAKIMSSEPSTQTARQCQICFISSPIDYTLMRTRETQ